MLDKPQKKPNKTLIMILNIIDNIVTVVIVIPLIVASFVGYFILYNPQKQYYIKSCKYAYLQIQHQILDMIKKQGYIYDLKQEQTMDDVCTFFLNQNPKQGGDCVVSPQKMLTKNFTFARKKIEVYGFEKPPFNVNGQFVKEILIDVDGENKGKNTIGIDRFPLRIYLSGRMMGTITPVNCNIKISKEFDIPYSNLCSSDVDINFLDTNSPIGFNIYSIGGKDGRTKIINENVSFIRADCLAFGGELIAGDYCEEKKYSWLKVCYDDYPCAINVSKEG